MGKPPSYDGSGLVNLVAEIETRMGSTPPSPGLIDGSGIPDAATYVLVLFDGLGVAQLEHSGAGSFRSTMASSLDSPFPSTTTVSLATVATWLAAWRHPPISLVRR